jgi:hypothetical protein
MCYSLAGPSITQETMRWKLFPFSLIGEAKQWYARTTENVNGDWGELRDNFCHSFSLMERTE